MRETKGGVTAGSNLKRRHYQETSRFLRVFAAGRLHLWFKFNPRFQMKLLHLPLFTLLLMSAPAVAKEELVTMMAFGFHSQEIERTVYVRPTPSETKTKCDTIVDPYGGYATTQCKSETTPGTPGGSYSELDHTAVSGFLIGNDLNGTRRQFGVRCGAHWAGSKCAVLIDGSNYKAVFDVHFDKKRNMMIYDHMQVYYLLNGKVVKAKYDVVSI